MDLVLAHILLFLFEFLNFHSFTFLKSRLAGSERSTSPKR